ncbi:MAG: ferritin-like domain-containing protein, partial [Acidobacteriota bacterium]
MKGSTKVLRVLNQALTEELSSINQYMVQAEMCDDWGYDRLHGSLEKQAMDEMHHAEWLIQRIIFLDGAPNVFKLNPFKIGNDVKAMLAENHKHELEAV